MWQEYVLFKNSKRITQECKRSTVKNIETFFCKTIEINF